MTNRARVESDAPSRVRDVESLSRPSGLEAVLSLDLEGKIVGWDPRIELISSHSMTEVVGQPLSRLFSNELAEQTMDELHQRATVEGSSQSLLSMILDRDTTIHVRLTVIAQYGRSREKCGFVARLQQESGASDRSLLEEIADSYVFDTVTRLEEWRQIEAKLRSEKRFSDTMIESMPGILYFYDSDGRFLRWNRNFELVSGYSDEEIAEMDPLQFFRVEDRPLLSERIAEVFRQGESSVEAPFLTKDGRSIPYFFTGRRMDYENRTCLVGVGIDVSDRKRAESLRSESERKYRELVELANSIILRWNSEGKITFLNEFGLRFFGFTADEIFGRHVIGTIVPESDTTGRDLRMLMDQICTRPEAFAQNVNENVKRNGERAWIAWTNRVVRTDDDSCVEILSVGSDVTAKLRDEEARARLEARYRKLFDHAPVGIVIADAESRYLDVNQSMCRMLGYEREELLGKSAKDIVVPSEVAHVAPAIHQINVEQEHYREWRFRRKDGSTFDAEVIATKMPDGNLLGMIQDVTDRKQAEAERERRHRAESADRIKSAFLATMSHELRTPLNSIIGFTGIILQELAGPLNAEQHKQLSMVRSSARHLLALVNDVLDISKIEAGQLRVASEPFSIPRSIERVVSSVRPQAEDKRLELIVSVDPALNQAISDERRFEQILLNLLSNAVKFTERGQVRLEAQFALFPLQRRGDTEECIVLKVTDTGIGIREDDLPGLFQPFRQLDSGLTRHHDGTGLGLAICRRLATLLGGEIRVESEWGRGSTFTVILPLHERKGT